MREHSKRLGTAHPAIADATATRTKATDRGGPIAVHVRFTHANIRPVTARTKTVSSWIKAWPQAGAGFAKGIGVSGQTISTKLPFRFSAAKEHGLRVIL